MYGLSNAGALCTGIITVAPSMVIGMWSEGPAPPRRLSPPALGSTRRTPKDCNSLISCSVGIGFGCSCTRIGFIGLSSGGGEGWCGVRQMERDRRAIVPQQRQQFGPCVVADRVHHALALDDQRHVEVGDQ